MENNPIQFCLKFDLSYEEYFAYHLVLRKDSSACDRWIKEKGDASQEVLKSLRDKGLIILTSLNPTSISSVQSSSILEIVKEDAISMAEELWNKYPAALPLGDGAMFIARKGPDKQEVLKLYLERINYSPEKHKYVLEQLSKYVKLVLDRKINGHRIHDWISNEMWDIISELVAASRGEFKTDI